MPSSLTMPAGGLAPSPERRRWILTATCTAVFMSAVEATIIATAMPSIVGALGGFADFSWVFAAYLLAQAVSTPIYGRLADLYGRKRVLTVATLIFLLGTTLCSLAWGMISLIAFRGLQGLGAGALVPISMTIIGDIYPPEQRAKIQGCLNALWGGASIIGPLLGAFLVATLGWQSVFWINVPIGIAALILLWFSFREQRRTTRHQVDVIGTILLVIGVGSLMLALVRWHEFGATTMLALLAIAAVALATLIVYERRIEEPMLPLDLWRHPVVSACNVAALTIGAVMMGVIVFLPTYVQAAMGRSPVIAGFTLTGESMGWAITGGLTGWVLMRRSYRGVAIIGGVMLVAGALLLVMMRPSSGPLWAATGAFVVGAGMGFCNTTFLVAAQSAVAWNQRASATASTVFMRNLGQAFGAAMFGGVLNASLAGSDDLIERVIHHSVPAGQFIDAITGAFSHVFLLTAFFAVVATALAFRLPMGQATKEA